ncbi:M23 family metallopeptidase [Microbacterium sp.]|uniref:M23 family metallopeptidase n=1 Tax=Microbacterium sp. TaxID=51671 RepID=UPI003F9691D7
MRFGLLVAYRYRGPVYVVSVVLLVAVALSSFLTLGEGARLVRTALAIGAMCLLAMCVVLALTVPRLLPERKTMVVSSPVRGSWLAMNSPASTVPSHGVRMYGQTYAIDLVHTPAGAPRPEFGDGPAMRRPDEYPAFGEAVFAMIDGTVVRSSDQHRDHRARSNWLGVVYMMIEGPFREIGGPGFILGNHVTIRGRNGEYATVAHLKQRSAVVRPVDAVSAGQRIGRCGNSGNSSEPHVHAQLMDRSAPLTAQGIPMAFSRIALGDDTAVVDALPKNDETMTASAALKGEKGRRTPQK